MKIFPEGSALFKWLRKWASPASVKLHHHAVVYRSNGALIVAPIARSKAGIGLEIEPSFVPQPIDARLFGGQIEEALTRSYRFVSDTGKDGFSFQPFLKIAKVRSYRAFMRDARRISILKSPEGFLVEEDENRGSKGFGSDRGAEPIIVPGTAFDVAQMVQSLLESDPPKVR
ncbi:hypothetical protein [Caulobacter sp. SSI4214]|uniref:hypothetical protein n=1 Tax=Caulobacter sp. SSI4214 TaxID=2575739 RepID=UPI001439EEDE|nr:hypothetical protein [Caulobacter sp. SSI4214]